MESNNILREMRNANKPSFTPTDTIRAHKGMA